ncbi:hypothetical protein P692DRAFT_20759488 [Suillus brevipes Sb2]|nr:hypothetical protein P692DRAFT_20759488 [Suillus brevipes Sb2]
MASIITDLEIESYPSFSYPSLKEFLAKLEEEEPRRAWSETFTGPLTSMGVRNIDEIEIVSPESLIILHKLCPLMVMDFFVFIINCLDAIHAAGAHGSCKTVRSDTGEKFSDCETLVQTNQDF